MAMSESGKALEPEHSVAGASPKPEEPISGEEKPQEHTYEDQIPIGRTLDVDSSDTDSGLGSETSSYVRSSWVTDYRVENGRRYHAYHDGAYYLPNDEIEIDRLDLQHHIWRMTLNNTLCISPLPENIQSVLDVGTGTGIWAIDFATEHPTAQVTGVDLSPIQPSMVPPNCTFIVDNIEQEWVYDKKFDLIHGRLLLMGIHDWPKLIRQAWDNTKPGGWIELQEGQFPLLCDDGSAGPDSPVVQWSKYLQQASQKVGLDSKGNEKFTEYLTAQGYTNLRVESLKWAIGGWPKGKKEKEIGKWTLENFLQGLSGVSMALFTRHLGWSREAVEVYLIEVRKHAKDLSSHVYFPITIHSAQKPLDSES